MFGELVILILSVFIWILNRGKKPFNEIGNNVQTNVSKTVLKISQVFVILLIIILVTGILITVYVSIRKFLFSN